MPYLCHQKMKAMMTREKVKEIEQYCAEHGMTFQTPQASDNGRSTG